MTEEQVQAVERASQPPVVLHPRTHEEFVLVRKERFDAMQKWMRSLQRVWNEPADDDLIAGP
jgi:hypothetical protein